MKEYEIEWKESAEKDIKKIEKRYIKRIKNRKMKD